MFAPCVTFLGPQVLTPEGQRQMDVVNIFEFLPGVRDFMDRTLFNHNKNSMKQV